MSRLRMEGRFGIVFALDQEARGLRRVLAASKLLAHRQRGGDLWQVGNVELAIEVSGVGRRRSAQATEWLIDEGAQWIVCAGFAAGLRDDLHIGDIVIAENVFPRGSDRCEAVTCSKGLADAVPPSGTLGYAIHRLDIVTSDTLVCSSADKRHVAAASAGALDMESYDAARVCSRRGVPFLAVRSISDTVDQELCPALAPLLAIPKPVKRLSYILARPKTWPDLLRLRRQARLAAANLGDVLGVMLLRII